MHSFPRHSNIFLSVVLLVSEVRQRRDDILENMELLCAQKDVTEFRLVTFGDDYHREVQIPQFGRVRKAT